METFMSNITEQKEEITFAEFTAWLTGVIRGKGGELPDLDDWKQIKLMMQKVQPEVVEKIVYREAAPHRSLPYYDPNIQYWPAEKWYITWGTDGTGQGVGYTSNQITITQPAAYQSMDACNTTIQELSNELSNMIDTVITTKTQA